MELERIYLWEIATQTMGIDFCVTSCNLQSIQVVLIERNQVTSQIEIFISLILKRI